MRQKGSRRYELPVDFPLTDSDGEFVLQDRRRMPDRRKTIHDLNDLKAILLKIYDN